MLHEIDFPRSIRTTFVPPTESMCMKPSLLHLAARIGGHDMGSYNCRANKQEADSDLRVSAAGYVIHPLRPNRNCPRTKAR